MELVISPTLNEAENVEALIEGVLAHREFELLIVDDDSPDGTAARVRRRQEATSRLHLLLRTGGRGFRASYVDGFRWALERGASIVYTMDADLSHRPEYLPALRRALAGGAGLAIGSRYVRGGGVKNWSPWRRLLSRSANLFAKAVAGLPVKDCTAGFLAIRAELLEAIRLEDSMRCNGYGFLIELKHRLRRAGAEIVEVPIIFHDRERGKTKFNSGMIKEAVATCFRLRFGGNRP